MAAYQADKRELAELWEALYLMGDAQEENAEQETLEDIVFPYTELLDGVVCFGGHTHWAAQMQVLLPNVRFVHVNYRFDTDIIRNSLCIWIQPCCISHKMYYRIINEARTVGIPCHYFYTLSVQSSARRLVETIEQGT